VILQTIQSKDGGHRLEVEVSYGEERNRIFFHSPELPLTGNSESLISLALPMAIRTGDPIQVEGEASEQFLNNLSAVQDYYLGWQPHFHRVEIQGITPRPKLPSTEKRVGVFFSAGLDSFYTFLKNREEITDLITIHGFDYSLDEIGLRAQVADAARTVASSYGKRQVEIETDAASFIYAHGRMHQSFGAFMACVGHLLYPYFSRIYIATGHTFDTLDIMDGSHPDLDPLWSSEALEFIPDGMEAGRTAKAVLVGESDVAMETLRVCVENRGGAYNCGKCRKCLRTMMNLKLAGALERCTTFDHPLDLKRVARMRQYGSRRVFLDDILMVLEREKMDPEMEAAVRKAMAVPGLKGKAVKLIERMRFRGHKARRFR